MTYGETIPRTRFQFDAMPKARRKAPSKKLARPRMARRVLHFIGFLSFWAVALSMAYLALLAAVFLFVAMS